MGSTVRNWLWTRLGGTVDDAGVRGLAADDPVVVFVGIPERARPVRDRLEAAGIAVTANARVADPRPLAADVGVSPRPSEVALEVRAADVEAARALLEP